MNPNFGRYSRNSHVRNGQPTPPPYGDKRCFQEMNSGSAMQQHQQQQLTPPYDDEKAKRERFLERNRLAASKCRQKKKKINEQLDRRHVELQAQNTKLHSEIDDLRSEILSLKTELLRHSDCGDPAIALHLSQMVKHITALDHAAADRRASGHHLDMMVMGAAGHASTGAGLASASTASLTASPPGLSTSSSMTSPTTSSASTTTSAAAAMTFGFDSPLPIVPTPINSGSNNNNKTADDVPLDQVPEYQFFNELLDM
ncbi:bZIP transcription factor atfB [Aspergillus homomorphus CBS 101889]|uniref:BZIP domain-containing protein n=1 Tax=Aspergillus homomorphus (strain CBS 101889) TaxID=1450537 RepID=A0A395I3R3_ASPHC|nr:hypothetical protein BO97DRAFT_273660 [Aspergillus homomorphus CBS 101889]RAL14597.1 hypothetical protein BO97DRAFT_273660 [Aspergillus homomorphus CBS 101889]